MQRQVISVIDRLCRRISHKEHKDTKGKGETGLGSMKTTWGEVL